MQLRALIELSGYCETRSSFLRQLLHKTFSPLFQKDLVFPQRLKDFVVVHKPV